MPDEIGFGDPNPRPARAGWRPLGRWSRLGWLLVLVVIATFVAVPRVRDHLAQGSAGALIADWATARAYGGQRDADIAAVEQRAGIADGGTVETAIQQADRELAAALSGLRTRIANRSTWKPDVAAAAHAAETALSAMVDVVRQDAAATHPFPSLVDLTQGPAVLRADDIVGRLQSRRHLQDVRPRRVALPSLRRALAMLDRPTDTSTGLRLIAAADGRLFAYDLDTGKRVRLSGDVDATTLTVAAGIGVVVTGPFGTRFLAPGRPARQLADHPANRVLPFGGDGFWLSLRGRVRAFDGEGRPTTRWFDVPAHLGQPAGATQSTLALMNAPQSTQLMGYAFNESGRQPPALTAWTPATGWVHRLHNGCALPITTIDQIIMVVCPADRVFAYDVTVHRLTAHDPPNGFRPQFFTPTPSPDGRFIAVEVDHGTDDDVDMLDLQTDRLVRFPGYLVGATPIGWSPDGQWLLLSTDQVQSRLNGLVLWNASTGRAMSVRLPAGPGFGPAGLGLV